MLNPKTAIFVVNPGTRALKVRYTEDRSDQEMFVKTINPAIKKGKRGQPMQAFEVVLPAGSRLVYSPHEPILPCGARMVITSEEQPEIIK